MAPFSLHRYRTSVHTSTRVTPFSLVYDMKVVLPVEVESPSMRVLMCHGQLNQKRMKQASGKKGRPREGDLVQKIYIFSTRLQGQVDT